LDCTQQCRPRHWEDGRDWRAELLEILKSDDHYASEAAQVILEHQSFFKENVRRLLSDDKEQIKRGLSFLEDLKNYGNSKLSTQLLNLYQTGNQGNPFVPG
jgi:hypothetical protein